MRVEPLAAVVAGDHVEGLWLSADAEKFSGGGRVYHEGQASFQAIHCSKLRVTPVELDRCHLSSHFLDLHLAFFSGFSFRAIRFAVLTANS